MVCGQLRAHAIHAERCVGRVIWNLLHAVGAVETSHGGGDTRLEASSGIGHTESVAHRQPQGVVQCDANVRCAGIGIDTLCHYCCISQTQS